MYCTIYIYIYIKLINNINFNKSFYLNIYNIYNI